MLVESEWTRLHAGRYCAGEEQGAWTVGFCPISIASPRFYRRSLMKIYNGSNTGVTQRNATVEFSTLTPHDRMCETDAPLGYKYTSILIITEP